MNKRFINEITADPLESRTNHCRSSLLFRPSFMTCLAPLVDKPVTFKLGNKCYFGFQTICWHQVMITALNSNGHSSGIYLDLIKISSRVLSLWSQVCFRECRSQLCTCCDLKVRKKLKAMTEISTHEGNHFMDFVQNPRMIFHSYFNKSYAESQ